MRKHEDLESTAATALVDVAAALTVQYPNLAGADSLIAAHELLKETAQRLRAGQGIVFTQDLVLTQADDGSAAISEPWTPPSAGQQ